MEEEVTTQTNCTETVGTLAFKHGRFGAHNQSVQLTIARVVESETTTTAAVVATLESRAHTTHTRTGTHWPANQPVSICSLVSVTVYVVLRVQLDCV